MGNNPKYVSEWLRIIGDKAGAILEVCDPKSTVFGHAEFTAAWRSRLKSNVKTRGIFIVRLAEDGVSFDLKDTGVIFAPQEKESATALKNKIIRSHRSLSEKEKPMPIRFTADEKELFSRLALADAEPMIRERFLLEKTGMAYGIFRQSLHAQKDIDNLLRLAAALSDAVYDPDRPRSLFEKPLDSVLDVFDKAFGMCRGAYGDMECKNGVISLPVRWEKNNGSRGPIAKISLRAVETEDGARLEFSHDMCSVIAQGASPDDVGIFEEALSRLPSQEQYDMMLDAPLAKSLMVLAADDAKSKASEFAEAVCGKGCAEKIMERAESIRLAGLAVKALDGMVKKQEGKI